jgi:3-phenylpropionate/trans-cinnamate dioxygenase ferredoxin reductase component
VLAVGDIAAALHARAGRRLRVEHWGDALAHGEVAGRTLAGERAEWTTAPGFWTTIGEHTLKHSAWGDGFDEARVEAEGDAHLVVRYLRDGVEVGVLALGDDDAYEAARRRLEEGP